MLTKLLCPLLLLCFTALCQSTDTSSTRKFNVFPILTYDSDTGLGYGGKIYLLNYLGSRESFDIIAFNSTKGERWYTLNFSTLDKEIRQGNTYPFVADICFDYDKWIKSHFYGLNGNASQSNDEIYTKTPFEASIIISRGFTGSFTAYAGVKYKSIKNSNYKYNGLLFSSSIPLDRQTVKTLAFVLGAKFDSRKSYINPKSGNVIEISFEAAPKFSFTNADYYKTSVSTANYFSIFRECTIMANRLLYNNISPVDVPVQLCPSLGGGSTLRGFNQDRFLGNSFLLLNNELRFIIFENLEGVGGIDIGTNFHPWNKFYSGYILGLRYILATFIVRGDVGISNEGTNIYLNFGHLF